VAPAKKRGGGKNVGWEGNQGISRKSGDTTAVGTRGGGVEGVKDDNGGEIADKLRGSTLDPVGKEVLDYKLIPSAVLRSLKIEANQLESGVAPEGVHSSKTVEKRKGGLQGKKGAAYDKNKRLPDP